jgi:hypothetical protein
MLMPVFCSVPSAVAMTVRTEDDSEESDDELVPPVPPGMQEARGRVSSVRPAIAAKRFIAQV